MKALLVTSFALALAAAAAYADPQTPAEMEKQALSLRVDDVAWRGIAWKSCLLEGLAEAKKSGKPAILWVFIDRPVNDERC
ncbi:MAG: hypothetical protein AAB074_22215 [Planctomycetota bacterium]|mgnify:CR=1 FL=1